MTPTARLEAFLLLFAVAAGACSYPSFREHRSTPPASIPAIEHVRVPPPDDPALANLDALPLLRLEGDGYRRGFLYGRAMSGPWRRAVRDMERHAVTLVREHCPPKLVARAFVRLYGAYVAQRFCGGRHDSRADVFFPPEYRAYVQGLADGAGIGADGVQRMIAFVLLSDASCSGFAAFGPATEDGRLIQLRNLDWGSGDLPVARNAVLLVHAPPGRHRYLSIGYVGLVGSISGINEAGISLTEIGAGSHDTTERGMPMPLLLEKVLAEAGTLDEAVRILAETPGTGGYNYIVGSARERRAAVVERTARRSAVFRVGPHNYADNPAFFGIEGFDARASTAAAAHIRAVQSASGGSGSPLGHSAYESRYRRQIDMFESFGRTIDIEKGAAIAKATACADNVQSVLYDFDRRRVYVRNGAWFADGREAGSEADAMRLAAAAQPAAVVDLDRVFPSRPPARPPTLSR